MTYLPLAIILCIGAVMFLMLALSVIAMCKAAQGEPKKPFAGQNPEQVNATGNKTATLDRVKNSVGVVAPKGWRPGAFLTNHELRRQLFARTSRRIAQERMK